MQLCILEAGLVPEEYRDRFGTYPAMTIAWLATALPEAEFSSVSVVREEALPEVTAFDGYIITGSRHGVYENLPWMQRLRTFLLEAKEAPRPVFGICFGHQIMAEAHGGKVAKSTKGWAIGAQRYQYQDGAGLAEAPAFVFHQDQVEAVPPNARVIGGNDHCAIGALEYDFPGFSVQYHPEFTKDYVTALAIKYGGSTISRDVSDTALAGLEKQLVSNRAIAERVATFFRTHLTQREGGASL